MARNYEVKEVKFLKEEDMLSYLHKLDETDIRFMNYINEAELSNIGDISPMLDAYTIANSYGITAPSLDTLNAIEEAVESTGTMWIGPVNGIKQAVPLSAVAMQSLSGRAGLYGPAIKAKPTILNMGFELHTREREDDKAKTLIRNGKLLASHSYKYQWLPQGQLADTNRMVFRDLFGEYDFGGGTYSDELTSAVYMFPKLGASLLAKYEKLCRKTGITDKTVPAVRFGTSDVTKSGANLYPILIRQDGLKVRIGEGIKLTHDSGHSMADYADNCYQVLTMLQDGVSRVEKMLDIDILYPENAFQNAVRRYSLPIGAATQAFEDFTIRRSGHVTAHELYFALWNIKSFSDCSTATALFDLEEKMAKLFFADWKKLDTPMLQ